MQIPSYDFIRTIKEAYSKGENISELISSRYSELSKTSDVIHYSYDLQAGSYRNIYNENADMREQKKAIGQAISSILRDMNIDSLLDAGVGEATTLADIIAAGPDIKYSGFDISLSRIFHARAHLGQMGIEGVRLYVADLKGIAQADSSVDAVFTFHAVEPNGGSEREILQELVRVARKYLVLVEPSYELGSDEQRQRMEKFNYCRGLREHLEALGCKVLEYGFFEHYGNPLNRPALHVVEVPDKGAKGSPELVSPASHGSLVRADSFLYCADDGFLFPVVKNIPVMLADSAILCSQAEQIV